MNALSIPLLSRLRQSRSGGRGFAYQAQADLLLFGSLAISILYGLLTRDFLIAGSIATLTIFWKVLPVEEGPPVFALALTYQWMQVTVGIFYHLLTGRKVPELAAGESIRTMVWIGLACILSLTAGIWCGRLFQRRDKSFYAWLDPITKDLRAPLMSYYLITVFTSGLLSQFAWAFPGLTQAVIAFSSIRFAFYYLLLRRWCWPTIHGRYFFTLVGFEVVLGATGFFASFREPLIIAMLALLEPFVRRGSRRYFASIITLGLLTIGLGIMWSGVKAKLRAQIRHTMNWGGGGVSRLGDTGAVALDWLRHIERRFYKDSDHLVSRLWVVYYPALAVKRVPALVPHENGKLLRIAILHILEPRLLFPDKPVNPSDSVFVRKYAGVNVSEKNTSIAFGYAGLAYVDFGIPLMFVPIFAFGLVMGAAYNILSRQITHRELAVATLTVIMWSSLYLFEQSWVIMFGRSVMLLIALGGGTVILDRYLVAAGGIPDWQRRRDRAYVEERARKLAAIRGDLRLAARR